MTSPPGRNDPCHCGSGRKYKTCHERLDREAAGTPQLRLVASAPSRERETHLALPPASQLSVQWELDVLPVPSTFADDPAARPAAVLVMSPPFVIACEMLRAAPAEPDALAAELARHVLQCVEKSGRAPTRVAIRHASIADQLTLALAPHGIDVAVERTLPAVEDAMRSLLAHILGGIVPLAHLHSEPETWAGWEMPPALVARFFRAAAAFYRAAPWRVATDEIPIYVSRPGEHEWATVVMGAAGIQTGLAMYHDDADLERMYTTPDDQPAAAFAGLRGTNVTLLYNTRAELPRPMRAEIKDAGWEVAAPKAYPTITVLNTPGGGIRARHFEDLIAAVESVPKFIARYAAVFEGAAHDGAEVRWTDPANGATCRMELEPVVQTEIPPPRVLAVAGPEGRGATPLSALDATTASKSVTRTLARYRAWLRKPPHGDPPDKDEVTRLTEAARPLVELCAHTQMKPVTAVTEYDVRVFLYDWYPRKVGGTLADARAMLAALGRFFAFLEAREHVVCAWVHPLLADVKTLEARCTSFPGGTFLDEAVQVWQQSVTMDLAARLLIPLTDSKDAIVWGERMGPMEFALNRDAQRYWVAWRDAHIRVGITDPAEVLQGVRAKMREWAREPNPICAWLTPKVAIARERKGMRRGR